MKKTLTTTLIALLIALPIGSAVLRGQTTPAPIKQSAIAVQASPSDADRLIGYRNTAGYPAEAFDFPVLRTYFQIGVQPLLVSGTNIKTVNGTSLLGSGDIVISGGSGGAWSSITGTPTTLAGYGITDAITSTAAASTYQPLITTGSIGATQIASTSVTAGSYTAANITVDADGRITAAANGAAGGSGDMLRTTYDANTDGVIDTAALPTSYSTLTIGTLNFTTWGTGTVPDANIASTLARDSEIVTAVSAEATARDNAIAAAVFSAGAGAAPGTVELYPTAMTLPAGRLLADGTNGTENITGLAGTKAAQVANATLTAPAVTPASGTYTSAQTVTATADAGATVFYAVGADPTRASTVYSAPITASTTAEYRFAQAKSPGLLSPITSRTYTINTTSYLMDEGFEETNTGGAAGSSTDGYDSAFASTETVTGTGATINPDATDMVGMVGTQSLKIVDTTLGNIIKQFDLGSPRSALWIKLRLTTAGLYAINRAVVSLADASGVERFSLVCASGMVGRMTINGTGTNSTAAFVNSAVQYVWIKYQNGAASGVYVSQTDTIPIVDGSGNIFIEGTGGAFNIQYIRIGANMSQAITYWYDDIKVSTTAFP